MDGDQVEEMLIIGRLGGGVIWEDRSRRGLCSIVGIPSLAIV